MQQDLNGGIAHPTISPCFLVKMQSHKTKVQLVISQWQSAIATC